MLQLHNLKKTFLQCNYKEAKYILQARTNNNYLSFLGVIEKRNVPFHWILTQTAKQELIIRKFYFVIETIARFVANQRSFCLTLWHFKPALGEDFAKFCPPRLRPILA